MAKDVSVFLAWASEPDQDARKRAGLQWMGLLTALCVVLGYYKRFKWAPVKT